LTKEKPVQIPPRVLALFLAATVLGAGLRAPAQTPKRLSEADLVKLIELQIGDEVIVSKIRKDGVSIATDEAAVERIRKAGASPAVIDALRTPPRNPKAPTGATLDPASTTPLVSFDDLVEALRQGIDEEELLNRLAASPTRFTIGQDQAGRLRRLGASTRLIDALKSKPVQAGAAGSDVTALAIILDCSGSMKERTPDGESKMDAAKRVLAGLIPSIPDGMDVAFVLYGFDARKACDAVEVVRPLKPLDDAGKQELLDLVADLRPVGSTPIALALRTAGAELSRGEGLSEIVLVTDGMETCRGKPAQEALALMARLHLKSVEVIGLGVNASERAGLEEIARAGKGHYYNARDAREVAAAFEKTMPVGKLAVEAPRIAARPAGVSGVVVTPLTLEGFPAIEYVALCKPETTLPFGQVQRSNRPGQAMIVPAGKFDLYYRMAGALGDPVLVVKELEVPARQTVTVQSNRVLAAIVVNDPGLGVKPLRVQVYPAGDHFPGRVITNGGASYGKPMVVAADREYDVLVTPEGGNEVVVAEGVRPKPGEMVVIGGAGDGKEAPGVVEAEESPPRPAAGDDQTPVEVVERKPAPGAADGEMTPKVAALVARLHNPDWEVRQAAARELGALGDEARPAVPALIRRVSDRQGVRVGFQVILVDGSRIAALLALKELAPDRVEEALRRAMQVPDFAMIIWARKTLEAWNQSQGKPANGKAPARPNSGPRFRQFGGAKTLSNVRGQDGNGSAPSGGFRGMGNVRGVGGVQQGGDVQQSGGFRQIR
jgi:hypothetical protein